MFSFLNCIHCSGNNIKIFGISKSGEVKSKCFDCGLTFGHNKEIKKEPEVFYSRKIND